MKQLILMLAIVGTGFANYAWANPATVQMLGQIEQERIELAQKQANLDKDEQQLAAIRDERSGWETSQILGVLLAVSSDISKKEPAQIALFILGAGDTGVSSYKLITLTTEKVQDDIDAQRTAILQQQTQLAQLETQLAQAK